MMLYLSTIIPTKISFLSHQGLEEKKIPEKNTCIAKTNLKVESIVEK